MHGCEHFDRVERDRLRVTERRQRKTGNQRKHDPHVLIGILTEMCSYCKALKFSGETKGMRCVGEKIKLPQLGEPPQPLKTLLARFEDQLQPKDTVLHRRNDQLTKIAEIHRFYDALQYSIVFWGGADGYHFNVNMINPSVMKKQIRNPAQ
ncbi:unnamed protein product [Onchocerca ochengi]|uniref:Helitron_like_N domain-containing protein n=1 Tax=Onchocerca ochengi TaxID=42157 RepID=A0A182E5T9_ONCOC|nr:unnamed protein product [Onchocerca ochengi]